MNSDFLPIPPDLMRNPELAILAVLRRTLDITYYALMAEYPDMYDDTSLFEQASPRISVVIARRILNLTSDLQSTIDRYRHRLEQEQERITDSNDIPF